MIELKIKINLIIWYYKNKIYYQNIINNVNNFKNKKKKMLKLKMINLNVRLIILFYIFFLKEITIISKYSF